MRPCTHSPAVLLVLALGLAGCPEEEAPRGPTPLGQQDARAEARQAVRQALDALHAPGTGPAQDLGPALAVLESAPAELLGGGRAAEAAAILEAAVTARRLPLARVEGLLVRLGPAGLAVLAQGLQAPEAEVRGRVAGRLAGAGAEGLRLLLASLAEGSGTDPALLAPAREGLVRLAGAASARERLQAVELLPHLSAGPAREEALSALAGLLADPAPEVRMAAVEGLCAQGPQAAAQAGPAVSLLRDADEGVRQVAAGALGRLGPPAVPHLAALLGEPDEGLRILAVGVLARVGTPALEVLLDHHDASPRVRVAVLQALAPLPDPRAFAALRAGLQDPEPRVRQEILRALAGREADPHSIELLGQALTEREPLLLRSALESLDRLGKRANAAAPALLRLAREGLPEAQQEAVLVLVRVSSEPRELVRQLGELLAAPAPGVRRAALEQLRALGPGVLGLHRDRLGKLALKDPDPGVRQAAVAALELLGAQPPGQGFG
jgi:HEAT repeat protein